MRVRGLLIWQIVLWVFFACPLASSQMLSGSGLTKSDGVATSYIYDESNRLIRVERPARNVVARYGYDPIGVCLWKENGAGQRTYYAYNGDGLEAELDSSGNVTKSYIFAPGSAWSTNPLAMKQGTSYSYYHNDHQGRPVTLTNNVGAVTWSGRYSAYGIGAITAQGATNHLRAPGQYSDLETGLYHNFQRNYDPELGTYIEEDPYGVEVTGPNRYLYVGGEPVLGTDPTGEIAPIIWIGFTIARPWIIRGAVEAGTSIARRLLQRRLLQEVAEFGIDEATNDFPLKRCIDGFSDPCRAGSMPDACYDFLMTHGPGWAMKPLKRLMDRFMPNLGFPGMGVDGVGKARKLPSLNQIERSIARGKAPKGVLRADKPSPYRNEKPHIHFDNNAALNNDGTWKHGTRNLSREERAWLLEIGWNLPD